MNTYPEDEFDTLARERGSLGAHRGPVVSLRKWWIALIAVVVVMPLLGAAVGHFYSTYESSPISSVASGKPSQAPTASVAPSASAAAAKATPTPIESQSAQVRDKTISIMLLNGKGVKGYAAEQGKVLKAEGYTNIEVGNYSKGAPAQTTVYYRDSSVKAAAEHVAQKLGGTAVESASAVGAGQIVAVLR
ncbi:LytR C-terminal domain-containing protein [Arcanobacterium canis]|uniref:LytR C-terminal domain-containing protein n=1 Tax=Arcanobacterium canis TaxID=999183 RepID=A0ABY8FYK1_9ACTO|nr:LytR C-terminal domain-containing protein [Arcanobacterium canis]WFM83604.1 LytR C-terminal domain-containing protein [Arcanobacterium canis]